ncbi:phytoene desaturase [Parafilimonas terrae]|uniref:Phytoene desaturase n=1 Tax=Parafilimonas terrae TaxID=1465490 RepID=A0A1I5XLD1_9BACT|nr:phytoene desaturase [Parafilimonas terrae]
MYAKDVIIIGSGFAGLSAACFLAKAGFNVTVLEKHDQPGGRARQLKVDGFSFDMGPSWYWMPDIFERFFNQFNKKVSDYYELVRLNPSYRIYWQNDITDIPADYNALENLFEKLEPGSSKKLELFLSEAAYKYKTGMQNFAYKPGLSIAEFLDAGLIKGIFRLDVFTSIKKHAGKYFKHPQLQQLLEFPVLFLGALPEKIPALYSLMNYADIKGGTWFPKGGMYSIVEAMYQLALELGVQFQFNKNVIKIEVENKLATKIHVQNSDNSVAVYKSATVIANADYHHTENSLLPKTYRNYSEGYWNKKIIAPSALIYYVGLNKKLHGITHHSLFFDTSFQQHAAEIYTTKQWPANPLFYVSATSATDNSLAPENCENLFFLVPVAAGLNNDTPALREHYFEKILSRFEQRINQPVKEHIIIKKTFACSNFVEDYNAYKGNAYGLANTLMQTAILKPSIKNKKIRNLFYTGQLTVPGPGVPPALISGEIVAKHIINLKK